MVKLTIKRAVLHAVADYFNVPVDSLTGAKTFRDLGGDVMDLTSIVITLEHELDIFIDITNLNEHTTMDCFVSHAEKARMEAV